MNKASKAAKTPGPALDGAADAASATVRSGNGEDGGVGAATSCAAAVSAGVGTLGASGGFQLDEAANTRSGVPLGAALWDRATGRKRFCGAARWSAGAFCRLLGGTTRGRLSTRSTAATVVGAGAGFALGRSADGAGAREPAGRLRGSTVSVAFRGPVSATRETEPASESTVDVA
jgi:hypothetical protein